MYEGSSGFRNLTFAALSKESVILEIFSGVPNDDLFNFSVEIMIMGVYFKNISGACVIRYLLKMSELDGSQIPILASDLH